VWKRWVFLSEVKERRVMDGDSSNDESCEKHQQGVETVQQTVKDVYKAE